jgi:hypothetical protein
MKTRLTLVIDVEDTTLLELQSMSLTQEDIDDGCDPTDVDVHTLFGCLYNGDIAAHYIVHAQSSEEM